MITVFATGDTESMKIWKFVQRSMAKFIGGHGVHFTLDKELGTRVFPSDDDDIEGKYGAEFLIIRL